MVLVLLKNKFRAAGKMGARLSAGQKVTAVLFQLVILGFLVFLGAFFRAAFFLLSKSPAGPDAVLYLLDHLFFLIFALAVVSGIVSGLYTMFRAREVEFLVGLPLRSQTIFDYLFAQNLILNTWPVAVLGLPLVFALVSVFGISAPIAVIMLAGLLPLTLCAESAGALIAVVFTRVFQRFHWPVTLAAVAVLGVLFAYFLADAIAPARLGEAAFGADGAGGIKLLHNARIDRLWLPNYWLARAYEAGLAGGAARSAVSAIALIFMTGAALATARLIGGRLYLETWMRSRAIRRLPHAGTRRRFPRFSSGLRGALVERDYLVFARHSNEISQAFFFFLLVLILVFIVSRYPLLSGRHNVWNYRAAVLLFGVISYYLVMLANRFVFPSLSLEGRAFWIVLSSPIKLADIFRAKLMYSAATLAVLGCALTGVAAALFRVPGPLIGVMLFWAAAAAAVIAAIALTMGTFYPDFSRQSASEISSSLAGLAAAAVSLLYGAVATALLAPVISVFYLETSQTVLIPVLSYLVLSLGIFLSLVSLSLKKLADFRL